MARPRPSSFLPSLLLGALLAASLPAVSADEPADSPSGRWTKAAAAFPAPSAEKGFDWEIELLLQGAAFGSGRFAAAPAEEGGTAVWKTTLTLTSPHGMSAEFEEVLGKTLDSIRGTGAETQAGERKTLRWEKTPEGPHKVRLQKGEAPAVEGKVDGQGRLLVNMSTGLLALRLLPAEAGEYEVYKLDDTSETADALRQTSRLSVKGVQKATLLGKEREVWLAEVKNGEDVIRVGLDPATRNLVAIEAVGKPIALVPKGQGKAVPKVDFAQPAKTAQIAAAKAAIGYATGDKDLVVAAIHWPSALAALKEENPDDAEITALDRAGLEALVVQSLSQDAERALIEQVVLSALDALTTQKLENGHVVVKFPDSFEGLALETAEIDGVWYVVKLPKS